MQRERFASEFAQLAYVAYLFAFRVPSEALQMRMAYKHDQLLEFAPHQEIGLMGIRTVNGAPTLIAKLSKSKNMRSGAILRRPCFCSIPGRSAHKLCPVHAIWPSIWARVQPGELIFGNLRSSNINRVLKAALKRIKIPNAGKYTSRAFRRGAATDLKETGSRRSSVSTLGNWRSLACKGYVGLSDELSQDIAQLFIDHYDFESGGEPEVHCVSRIREGSLSLTSLGRILSTRFLEYSENRIF